MFSFFTIEDIFKTINFLKNKIKREKEIHF